jgi:hypothetical protein
MFGQRRVPLPRRRPAIEQPDEIIETREVWANTLAKVRDGPLHRRMCVWKSTTVAMRFTRKSSSK